jgi:pimeloyl-ACP methyl ester carboxylesterase
MMGEKREFILESAFKESIKVSSRIISFLFILLLSLPTYAGQTLVLIHGYLGDGSTWRPVGIVSALQPAGWQDAGHLFPGGPLPGGIAKNPLKRYIYSVTLPSEAPLATQAQLLDFYLRHLQQRHLDNTLILVGHSAGGVVARLVMVVSGIPIQGLITIASPHLGTEKAEWATLLSNSPFSWITPFLGLDTINRSKGLYWDLVREHPTSFLFWLNRQPHPKASYISIVRLGGDDWVPPYSQDMNDVPVLRGLARTIPTTGNHSLHPTDGPLLLSLLDKMLGQAKGPKN